MLSYKRLHIFTTPLLARSSLLHVSWVLRYHSPGGNVGSWRRSVNVAVIPSFPDARGCGWPPRFRTLVTGAQIAMCAALVFFTHFRRYTRRLRTCRSSLSLSQLGRAVRGGCALLLPNVKRINMIRGERVFWFVWNRRLDGGGGSLSLNGEIGQIPSSAIDIVTPYWSPRRRPIFPYI